MKWEFSLRLSGLGPKEANIGLAILGDPNVMGLDLPNISNLV
jgi:hypothetical protein